MPTSAPQRKSARPQPRLESVEGRRLKVPLAVRHEAQIADWNIPAIFIQTSNPRPKSTFFQTFFSMYNRHNANPDRSQQSNDPQTMLLPSPRRFARRPRCSLLALISTVWCGAMLLLFFYVNKDNDSLKANYRVISDALRPGAHLPSPFDLIQSGKWSANMSMFNSLVYSQSVSYTNNFIYSNLPTLPPATRCFLLFGIMAGNELALTYRTVDSVISKTSYDRKSSCAHSISLLF